MHLMSKWAIAAALVIALCAGAAVAEDSYYQQLPVEGLEHSMKISVDVPAGTRYMECDMTLTYKRGKLAFSTYDMQVVVPLGNAGDPFEIAADLIHGHSPLK